ncbi:glycosyltransferase family 2 protein [Aerosakkonema sp. BLCC-F183]|uniref:glycosyltransferase family 2 protein n=1 Tax=Aerosakkonema sp. BLCC-F183 TaxID=3342834 RepID=UPI0035BB44D8
MLYSNSFDNSQGLTVNSAERPSGVDRLELISVIIPTWNRAGLIKDAIHSVQQQTWPNVEIIVVDDGSTDETPTILANFPRILYLRQTHQGQGAARNLGLRYAQGTYLATLDSDDVWRSNFLEQCINAIKTYDLDLVFANWELYHFNGDPIPNPIEKIINWQDYSILGNGRWRLITPDRCRNLCLEICPAPSSGVVFRRASISGNWNTQLRIADDWCFLLETVLSQPCRAGLTREILWVKRADGTGIHDGCCWLDLIEDFGIHDNKLILDYLGHLLTNQEKRKFIRNRARCYVSGAWQYWQKSNCQFRALRMLLYSFVLSPVDIPIYILEIVKNKLKKYVRHITILKLNIQQDFKHSQRSSQ